MTPSELEAKRKELRKEMGFSYVGCELDKDYYKSACERIAKYREQLKFDFKAVS